MQELSCRASSCKRAFRPAESGCNEPVPLLLYLLLTGPRPKAKEQQVYLVQAFLETFLSGHRCLEGFIYTETTPPGVAVARAAAVALLGWS